jgi:branched-chain amino acid transport system permease protein
MLLQAIIIGLVMGSIYAIMGSGLTIIFGVMRIINFAHGEFMMIAMYITYLLFKYLHLDPFLSIFLTVPFLFILGVAMNNTFIARVAKVSADATLLMTLGISFALINIAQYIFGSDYLWVNTGYSSKNIPIFSVLISYSGAIISIIAFAVIGILFCFMKYSKIGYEIRASMQDRKGALLVGINVDRVSTLSFGLGAAMAGVAGSLLVHYINLFPAVGVMMTLKSFVIVVFGGMGSIGGALFGGLILGIVESLWGVYFFPGYREAISFLALVVIFLIRPLGLFGKYGL